MVVVVVVVVVVAVVGSVEMAVLVEEKVMISERVRCQLRPEGDLGWAAEDTVSGRGLVREMGSVGR